MHSVGLHCLLILICFLYFRFWMVTSRVGDSNMSERDICDIIVAKILRFIREDTNGLIRTVREELITMVDERLRISWAKFEDGWPLGRRVTFIEFNSCRSPHFFGCRDPILSMHWITIVVSGFHSSFCLAEAKFKFATCILHDRGRDWWCEVV